MVRGRPRAFDEDVVLSAAMHVFWAKGFAATSLDDLADAMKMNRPSIYNAFGNKEEIYRTTLARFCGQLDAALQTTLDASPTIRPGLMAFFEQAIEVYVGGRPPMGCLMICTAPSEALTHPEVGEDLRDLISRLDRALTRRLERARKEGELADEVQPKVAAKLLQATLQTIALRARCGESKRSLKALALYAVNALVR